MRYGTVLTWGLFIYSGVCMKVIMSMQYGTVLTGVFLCIAVFP